MAGGVELSPAIEANDQLEINHDAHSLEVRMQPLTQQRKEEARLQQEAAIDVLRQEEAEANRVHATVEAEQRRGLLKLTQFVWLGFGVVEGLIGLRILLKLIAANPDNPFAQFIYSITDLFLWPFVGLTRTPAAQGIVLEIHSIIALFVYALLSVLIERMIRIIFSRPKV